VISILFAAVIPRYLPSFHCPTHHSVQWVFFGLLVCLGLVRYDFFDLSLKKMSVEILESIGQGVVITDRQGETLAMNGMAASIFGMAELSGKADSLFSLLREGSGQKKPGNAERVEIEAKDRARIFAFAQHDVVRQGNVWGTFALIDDVTDRVEKEKLIEKSNAKLAEAGAERSEGFKHAQKMEALGILSRGMAHEFNNLLFAIFGFTAAARDDLEPNDPLRNDLKEIIVAAKRAKDIVRKIREFSHPEERTRLVVEMAGIVREVGGLLKKLIPSEIRFEIDAQDVIGLCFVESGQVSRAILNLGRNAIQASDKKDAFVRLSAHSVSVEEDLENAYPPLKRASYVRISVEDNGMGIPRETQARIFDPFFTTKERGQGIGLGLSTVFGVVQSHGGSVQVISKEGEGSTFSIYLPLVEQTGDAKEDAEASASVRVQGGTERILFVDDEQQIARAGKRMLEPLGYRVTALTSSLEALALFRREPHGFDLVVSDFTMPEINGIKLAEEIFGIRSDIPIVLITGFAETRIRNPAKQIGVTSVLYKPLTKFHLGQVVRQVLDSKKGDR